MTLSLTKENESEGSPFADMSVEELYGVQKYLFSQGSLNITPVAQATVKDSYIFMIEALRPNKNEALLYLDGSGPLPERAARVIIFRFVNNILLHTCYTLVKSTFSIRL